MNAYKITGTSREVGAIGMPESYERIIIANTAREAYNTNRQYLYDHNREHVLTTEIQESRIDKVIGLGAIGTSFQIVDPEMYL